MAAARFSVFSHAFRRRTESNGTGCGEKSTPWVNESEKQPWKLKKCI